MNIMNKAYVIDYAGKNQSVVEDGPLLDWAEKRQKSPAEAQRFFLENNIIPLRYLKNFWALNLNEQKRLCASKALICGCGGLGGVLMNLLARAGVGYLRLVDNDVFVPSNLNRQWACNILKLSQPKSMAAAEQILAINPFIEVEARQEFLDDDNGEQLVSGMDLVLDAVDNIETRFVLNQWASRLSVPFIHAAIAGWWGQISTFLPESGFNLENIYGKRRSRDAVEEATGVLGAAVSTIASLQALEAVRILSGRPSAYAGKLFYFDGETGQSEIIPLQ